MAFYPYDADKGQTDLMAAAYNGDADEIARLLGMPCDIDAQDCHGMTALMYAAIEAHSAAVAVLIDHKANLELQSSRRWTALMYAVRAGDAENVRALLKAGADPDVHDDYDTFETPLTLAARRGFSLS